VSKNTGDGGGSGGGGDTTVSSGSDTSWMEGIDFTDKASVQKWVDSKEGLGMSGLAENVSGRGGIFGAIPQAIQAQDIAKVRGLAAVYAESDPEFAKELLTSAQKSIDASGSLVISAFEKLGLLSGADAAKQLNSNITDLALTRDSVDAYGNPIFKDDDDWFAQLQAVAPAGMTYDPTLKSTVTDPTTGEETEVTGGYSSDDGDPFAWMENIGGVQQVETGDDVNVYEITDSEEFEATGGIRPKTRPDTGANTGGLMTTPKPKKKSKPKKTGLAGKK
jgi:hypothetical protein